MRCLAIETSTADGSVAVVADGLPECERCWTETHPRRTGLFGVLASLRTDGMMEPGRLDLLAVGLGPGSFTALRMAIAAAIGLALPGRIRVCGVSSAEALAWEVSAETEAESVTVFGDARRGEAWMGCFEGGGGLVARSAPWQIVDLREGPALPGGVWVTPDWDRIGSLLERAASRGVRLIRGRRVPGARAVGALAVRRAEQGLDSDPLVPLYLRPPVGGGPPRAER
jgi:tRNA threonylcarbamoyl adenosine modification protein YeaZ